MASRRHSRRWGEMMDNLYSGDRQSVCVMSMCAGRRKISRRLSLRENAASRVSGRKTDPVEARAPPPHPSFALREIIQVPSNDMLAEDRGLRHGKKRFRGKPKIGRFVCNGHRLALDYIWAAQRQPRWTVNPFRFRFFGFGKVSTNTRGGRNPLGVCVGTSAPGTTRSTLRHGKGRSLFVSRPAKRPMV